MANQREAAKATIVSNIKNKAIVLVEIFFVGSVATMSKIAKSMATIPTIVAVTRQAFGSIRTALQLEQTYFGGPGLLDVSHHETVTCALHDGQEKTFFIAKCLS